MTKRLQVRPDDDETITLSHACNAYSIKHFRIYNSDTAKFFVVVSQHNDWYMVNASTNVIVKTLGYYPSIRCLLAELLKKGYKIELTFDEE